MNLKFENDLFIAEYSTILDHDMLRRAGFAYDRKNKKWVTPFASVANKVAYNLTNDIKEALAQKKAIEKNTFMNSLSTHSAIKVPVPSGLKYYSFQLAGIKFIRERGNVLLADDQGIGKSIQVIGYINSINPIERYRVLIVCPASLKINWANELTKWLCKKYSIGIANSKFFPDTDIVIVNYDILIKLENQLRGTKWSLLVLDECHYLKNSGAKRTRAVFGYKRSGGINSSKVIALTGTPILNKPIELYPIANYLNPFAFPNKDSYARRYCAAHRTRWGYDMNGASNLDELQAKLRSTFMIRRKKEEVLTELPPKVRQIIEIDPDKQCLNLLKKEKGFLSGMSSSELDSNEYKEIVQRLSGVKVGFEQMSEVRQEIALLKTPLCFEHIRNAIESQKKVVIFFWHKEVGKLLKQEFKKESVILSGDTPNLLRQAAIDRFQNDDTISLFFGNIKAAGVGITLTAASLVIFLELTWVPGEIIQAEDRLHRIGQVDTVFVQHLVLSGSLDATMCKTLIAKQKIIEDAIDMDLTGDLERALT